MHSALCNSHHHAISSYSYQLVFTTHRNHEHKCEKSVQLVKLHAFAYCLLFVYLSESFNFLKGNFFC